MSKTLSTDEPLKLAIFPDWGASFEATVVYRTDVDRSRSGLEQRHRRRKRPLQSMTYQNEGSHEDFANLQNIEARKTSRRPLLVPWWISGSMLSVDMAGDLFSITTNPIVADWEKDGWAFLWDDAGNYEFRKIASRESRAFALEPATEEGRNFKAGDYAAPAMVSLREMTEDQLTASAIRTVGKKLAFRTL